MSFGNYYSQIIVLIVVAILYKFNLDMISKVIQNMFHNAMLAERKTSLN